MLYSKDQPLKLEDNRVWRTYKGGKLLDRWRGQAALADGVFPEEWVASTVRAKNAGREHIADEGLSRVRFEDGHTEFLHTLIESDPAAYLGASHMAKYGAQTALLVKILDAGERLTIQVHPDKLAAKRYFNSDYGKTEAWYILGGRQDDGEEPCVYLGFKPGMTKEKWRVFFEAQDIQGMKDALHRFPVKEGDVYLVEAGVPHAIGNGCFMIEIQEPTDFTLRTERTTPSGLELPDRACHQGIGFEPMFDCFLYDVFEKEQAAQRWKKQPRLIRDLDGGTETALIGEGDTECFLMNKLDIRTELPYSTGSTFAIAIVIDGEGLLKKDGKEVTIRQADRFFIPAVAGNELTWINTSRSANLQVIVCFPPK